MDLYDQHPLNIFCRRQGRVDDVATEYKNDRLPPTITGLWWRHPPRSRRNPRPQLGYVGVGHQDREGSPNLLETVEALSEMASASTSDGASTSREPRASTSRVAFSSTVILLDEDDESLNWDWLAT